MLFWTLKVPSYFPTSSDITNGRTLLMFLNVKVSYFWIHNNSKQRIKKTLEHLVFTWNCENTSSPIWLNSGMELLSLVKLSDFLNFVYKTQKWQKRIGIFTWKHTTHYSCENKSLKCYSTTHNVLNIFKMVQLTILLTFKIC